MRISFSFLILFFLSGCLPAKNYDLVIKNARILDVKSGKIICNQTILIVDGLIEDIVPNGTSFKSRRTLNANSRLITPSFVDSHIHPTDVFGDYENAPKFLSNKKSKNLKKELSDQYLPFGTTTVLTMGQPENWLKTLVMWQRNKNHNLVDFFLSGGAMISKDNRVPYIGHTEVVNPFLAKQKILEYHKLGLKHVKFYYRLKEPEFSACTKIADSLKMTIFGHIGDFSPEYLNIKHTLAVGLTNYEHIATIPNSIITSDSDWEKLMKQFNTNYGELNTESKMLYFFMEQFRFIEENKAHEMDLFLNMLARKKVTFSTTIHRIYEQFEPTYFTNVKDTTLNSRQLQRCKENFSILMKYALQMQRKGIELRLGSDMPNGGKVNVSELIILNKYNFKVSEIFKIACYNGAKSMKLENKIGSLEIGKNANMILWEYDPFVKPTNFAKKITVIKDGVIIKATRKK